MNSQCLIKTLVFLGAINVLVAPVWADYSRDTSADDSAPKGSTISTAPRYFQPVNPSAPRSPSTPTGTRRGGCFDSETSPFILAPSNFVGITAESRPTFTWFLPNDESVPVEFSFYRLGTAGSDDLKHIETLTYEAGINQYQLPLEVELEPGERYLWQLVLYCNPNRPSTALVYEAEVDFVPILENSIQIVDMAVHEQAQLLAEAGYWYDAIATLGTSQQSDISAMRSVLLDDLAIAEQAIAPSNENPVR